MYFIVVDGCFIILSKPSGTEELRKVVKMVFLLATEWNKSIEFTQIFFLLQPLERKESSALDIQIMLNSRAKTVDCI